MYSNDNNNNIMTYGRGLSPSNYIYVIVKPPRRVKTADPPMSRKTLIRSLRDDLLRTGGTRKTSNS